jgi:hypothetical protein
MPEAEKINASFRDPSGFLFTSGGTLYRQINQIYADNYIQLMESGLYESLLKARLLIPHVELNQAPASKEGVFKIIQPERVPFISYPYEWSFSQLKDAALATLAIQKRAMKYNMSLKDASAYNIQFLNSQPVLIDTISFEAYIEGQPWVAYRQFCQHFLAPLALMAYCDIRLNQLLRVHIDGVPLDLASRLLPRRTMINFGLLAHLHLHASTQKRYTGGSISARTRMSKEALASLIESLKTTITKLTWKPSGTQWWNYYDNTNYSDAALEHKKQTVSEWVGQVKPATVWDLGANTGEFSRLTSALGAYTIAFDLDPAAVELCYLFARDEKKQNLLPLVLDLTNPSPAVGWANRERESFASRGPADMILALALIHHLAITNNVPLPQIAEFFAELGRWLVIEFIPKSDSQVRKMLSGRQDIFPGYSPEGFLQAFEKCFTIHASVPERESERHLFLMERR